MRAFKNFILLNTFSIFLSIYPFLGIFFFSYFTTVERGSLTFATGRVVPPCGHIADYIIQVGVNPFTLWEDCWVQLLLKCDHGNTKMTKNISVVVANIDIIREGLQPQQILCQQCFKMFSKVWQWTAHIKNVDSHSSTFFILTNKTGE